MCMCVSTPKAINNYTVYSDWILCDWLNNSCCFPVSIYGPAVCIKHGCGPSNMVCRQ